jgi:hypothetical protein
MANFIEDSEDLSGIQAASTAVAAAPAVVPTQVLATAPEPVAVVAPEPVAASDDEDESDPAPAAKASAKSTKSSSEEFDVEFGDEKLMEDEGGLKVPLRPDTGKTVRFALLTDYVPAKRAFNHYIDKKGTFICLSPEDKSEVCCTGEGQKESQPQIVALVLHYTNADPKTGQYKKDKDGVVPPTEWEIRFSRLSRSAFKRISKMTEEDGKPTDIDITMCHKSDGGIGYEYNRTNLARWKKNPALVKEVEAALQPFIKDGGKKLISRLGRKISKTEWRILLAGSKPASDASNLEDISDI